MATDAKKHTTIAAGEQPSRAGIANAIFSIGDVVPVANATEASQVASAVAAAGQSLATAPLTVSRADARGLHRIEYTYDGSVFLPASGVLSFTSLSAATSWASSNSAYLVAGDECNVAGVTYWWTGSKWVPTADSGPHVVYARTTAFSFTTTETILTFDSSPVEGSLGGALSTSDYGTFTCVLPGVYQVAAMVTSGGWATATISLDLFKNAAAVRTATGPLTTSSPQSLEVVYTLRLAATDTISLRIKSTATANAFVTNASNNNVCIDYIKP